MFQTVFNGALASGEMGRFCRRVRRWLLKCSDPIVSWQLNGRNLRLPLSHQLPFYRREFPTYSANLERLVAALRQERGPLVMIDVGANVGDSLALAGVQPNDACLLIEGNREYCELLKQNTADLPGAVCLETMLSDCTGEIAAKLLAQGGTAKVIAGSDGPAQMRLLTLDSIVAQQPQFSAPHLLKVDVDGYDLRVLRGGQRLIRDAQPILFFEQHPVLLLAAGEDPDTAWSGLKDMGYDHVLLYDNLGYWIGTFSLAQTAVLCQLNSYARQRSGFYYDVVAFPPRYTSLQASFAAAEARFYSALKGAP